MNKPTFTRSETNGIRIHVLPTKRFKTFSISLFAGVPLQEETVTPTALLPFVMRRGTQSLPITRKFRKRLDDLYGAGFGFDIYKRGDYQLIHFKMDTIHHQYVKTEHSNLLQESLNFIGEVITRPYLENRIFSESYVEAEKNTLHAKIQAIVNDKIRFAAERCIEEMCKHEPYRLHPLGSLQQLPNISAKSLFEHYEQWLDQAAIDLYVVGDTNLQEVQQYIDKAFTWTRKMNPEYLTGKSEHYVKREVNRVTDELDVSQGKLNMGLRANVRFGDDDYPVALVYNGILGAFPHSKLFMNVRERESLAYYAGSRYDGHKGILTIQSGIEFENVEKAIHIIQQQLEMMREGQITELEMEQTKAMIQNQLKEINDSSFELMTYDFNGILSGRHRDVQELIDQIQQMTVASVQKVAQNVVLDTIYFLKNRKGEVQHAD